MNTLHRFCPARSVDNPNQNHQKPMSQAVRTTGSEAGISQPIESQPIKNKTDTDSYRLMTEAIGSIRQAEEAVERLARFRMQQKIPNCPTKYRMYFLFSSSNLIIKFWMSASMKIKKMPRLLLSLLPLMQNLLQQILQQNCSEPKSQKLPRQKQEILKIPPNLWKVII